MRALFCPLGTPGFVYPAIAVARAFLGRGHTAAFVTAPSFKRLLSQLDIERIPCGDRDRESFQVERWHNPLCAVMQVKHIEYAIQRFAPDVLVTHPLSLGAHIIRERAGIPLAVLGLSTYLWPVAEAAAPEQSETDRRRAWRHAEMIRYFDEARRLFKLAPTAVGHRESPFLGDLYMLQSVAEMGIAIDDFPEQVHLSGACLWEPPPSESLRAWVADAISSSAVVIYVQHGRSFGSSQFWRPLVASLRGEPVRVAAALGRMDGERGEVPPTFFVDADLVQGAVLPHARVVVTGGNTTSVLGALTHGVPSLIVPGGGEQADVAEQVTRAGAALTLPLGSASAETMGRALRELLGRDEISARARALASAFSRVPGPERAALLIEELGRTRLPVTRARMARASGDVCR